MAMLSVWVLALSETIRVGPFSTIGQLALRVLYREASS